MNMKMKLNLTKIELDPVTKNLRGTITFDSSLSDLEKHLSAMVLQQMVTKMSCNSLLDLKDRAEKF